MLLSRLVVESESKSIVACRSDASSPTGAALSASPSAARLMSWSLTLSAQAVLLIFADFNLKVHDCLMIEPSQLTNQSHLLICRTGLLPQILHD